MPLGLLADNAVQRHRRRGLDQDDAVDHQFPQAQDPVQARSCHAHVSRKEYGSRLDSRGHEVT